MEKSDSYKERPGVYSMTVREYVKDYKMNFILQILFFVILIFILLTLNLDTFAVIYIAWIGILCMLIAAVYDYMRKRRFYHDLKQYFGTMDHKYLISEMLGKPEFMEGKMFWNYMQDICKDANDELLNYKRQSAEYREYIEMWIHEVKTPVAAMKLIAENHPDERMKQMAEEVEKVDYYLDQALYYARSSGVEKDYMVKELNIKEVVEKVLRTNARLLIKSKVRVRMENLEKTIYSDEKWIEFILKQIIINAVKYRREGDCQIEFRAIELSEQVILEIMDNGIGISPRDLPKVTQKGYTGTTGRKYAKSTGMGLYLCSCLSRKLGLHFSIESEEGAWTKVRIGFPRNSMTFLKKEE